MARPLKHPHELPFSSIEARFDLASMQLGYMSTFRPAVFSRHEDQTPGYGIRILVGHSYNGRTQTTSNSWDYFYTDESGLVTQSPRGLGGEYNGRYRITGLAKAVEEYKDKRINHA